MTRLEIYGRSTSINTQKVLWAAEEVGCEFVRHDVGGPFGGLETESYRALNPNGRIPTLIDGDSVLWESNAIVRYLAAAYGDGVLWIEDPAERASAERWMDWQHTTLLDDMRTVFVGLAQTPPDERDRGAIESAARRLQEIWGRLDEWLRERPFVAGERFTMADIPAAAWCHRYFAVPVERSGLDALTAWYRRMGERASYRTHVMNAPL